MKELLGVLAVGMDFGVGEGIAAIGKGVRVSLLWHHSWAPFRGLFELCQVPVVLIVIISNHFHLTTSNRCVVFGDRRIEGDVFRWGTSCFGCWLG